MYIKILIIVLVIVSIIFLTTTHAYKKKEGLKTKKNKDYLDGIDVIYWINLERSQDRRKNMEKMFESLNQDMSKLTNDTCAFNNGSTTPDSLNNLKVLSLKINNQNID